LDIGISDGGSCTHLVDNATSWQHSVKIFQGVQCLASSKPVNFGANLSRDPDQDVF